MARASDGGGSCQSTFKCSFYKKDLLQICRRCTIEVLVLSFLFVYTRNYSEKQPTNSRKTPKIAYEMRTNERTAQRWWGKHTETNEHPSVAQNGTENLEKQFERSQIYAKTDLGFLKSCVFINRASFPIVCI
ncbi:hypothetical protein BY458DRAFT_486533 [Sporodiniella umbellata]|nr:hypothetical protein BY458DRAFT_486533 [Sporodiniella umbellata]